MVHNQFYILEKLIRLLDDPRNDIYIHVDSKVKNFDFDFFSKIVKSATLYYTTKRIDVRWGHISQIETELILFEEAHKQKYVYYHLLSGVDLPIKSQDYIHAFFEKHNGWEFIGFTEKWDPSRVTKINLFTSTLRYKIRYMTYLRRKIREFLLWLQGISNFEYNRYLKFNFKKGSNWVSLTDNAISYLLNRKSYLFKLYKYASCADEVYKQTALYNSALKNSIFRLNEGNGSLRSIDWERGDPYVYRKSDFLNLLESECLFARKFDVDVDKDIIDMIYHKFHYDCE